MLLLGQAPDQGCTVGVVLATLVVGPPPEGHDVVAALLDEHPDDALYAIADEVATHLHALLLGLHQLRPAACSIITMIPSVAYVMTVRFS